MVFEDDGAPSGADTHKRHHVAESESREYDRENLVGNAGDDGLPNVGIMLFRWPLGGIVV